MKFLISSLAALTLAGPAAAQDVYAGLGLDYHFPHSGDHQVVSSGLVGITIEAGVFAIGAEAEYGLRFAGENDYDTARVRGFASYDFAGYDLRFAGGITEYYFDDDTAGGFNLGLGAQRAIGSGLILRGELIRDFVDNTFTQAITTTRAAVVYEF